MRRYAQDGWKTEQDFWGSPRNDLGTENFDAWADLDGSNALVARRVFGDGVDESTARVIGSAMAWYHRDVRGSVTALTSGSGAQLGAIAYDGFGKITSDTTGGNGDRFAYSGRERDSLTGLQYNRARWYDPGTARWQSEDPLGQAAGDVNLHRYAGNGPTNWTDPSGYAAVAQNLDELPAGSGVVHDVYRIPRMTPESFGPQPIGEWRLPSRWGEPGPSIQNMQQGGSPSREHFEAIVMAGAPGDEPIGRIDNFSYVEDSLQPDDWLEMTQILRTSEFAAPVNKNVEMLNYAPHTVVEDVRWLPDLGAFPLLADTLEYEQSLPEAAQESFRACIHAMSHYPHLLQPGIGVIDDLIRIFIRTICSDPQLPQIYAGHQVADLAYLQSILK